MDRREFVGSSLVALAAAALPVKLKPETPPKLWGDGFHDDTDALQWRLDHGPVVVGGTYRIRGTLHITPDSVGGLYGTHLMGGREHTPGSPMVYIHNEHAPPSWRPGLANCWADTGDGFGCMSARVA